MGVRRSAFAKDANPAEGLLRTPYEVRKINPQNLNRIFNRDSKWIAGYPQVV